MAEMREKDGLITPQWLITARKRRARFILRVAIVFALFSVLAFWAIPALVSKSNELIKEVGGGKLPAHVNLIVGMASAFKAFWVVISIGCGISVVLALVGKIDSLLPAANIILLLVAVGVIIFTFYVFILPLTILTNIRR